MAIPDAGTIEKVNDMPVVVVLGLVCCFLAWLNYKQGENFTRAMADSAKAMNALALELRDRPCLHLHQRSGEIGPKPHRREGE
jgi:hypothetical protein